MDYRWHYDELIRTRKERVFDSSVYTENHHVVLKSMGGTEDESNKVRLTAREHFLAHWLLWRIHRNRQTAYAFKAMCKCKNRRQCIYIPSSRVYQEAREAAINTNSQKEFYSTERGKEASRTREYKKSKNKSNIGVRNSQYGKIWITNGQQNDKVNSIDQIPTGWRTGRTMSENTREKMSIFLTGKVRYWINNGIKNSRIFSDEQLPIGWSRGKI